MNCKIIIVLFCAITAFAAEKEIMPITACCTDCTLNHDLLKRLVPVHGQTDNLRWQDFEFNITYSGFNCSFDGTVLTNSYAETAFEFGVREENGFIFAGRLEDKFIPLLNSSDYCIEENGHDVIARLCYEDKCKGNTCIRKCCPEGHIFDLDEKCKPDSDDDFRIPSTFMDENMRLVPVQNESLTVVYNYFPWCDSDHHHRMYGVEDETVFLLTSGGIVVRGLESEEFHTRYCVDHIKQKDGTSKMAAMACTLLFYDSYAERTITTRILPVIFLISTLLLVLTFVVYAMLPELRCVGGKIVMCHVLPLWISFALYSSAMFSTGVYDHRLKYMCVATVTTMHFFFLAALNWLNVTAFDIFWTFRKPDESNWYWNEMIFGRIFSFAKETGEVTEQQSAAEAGSDRSKDRRKFTFYSVFAWGYAALVVLVGFVSDRVRDHMPEVMPSNFIYAGVGEYHCLFESRESLWLYLYGPIVLAMIFNVIMFGLTASKVSQKAARLCPGHTWPTKEKFYSLVKLSLLMGLMWLVKWVSIYLVGSYEYMIVVYLALILMPIGIFLLFVWKQKVLELSAARYSFVRRVLGNSAYKRPSTNLNLKPSRDESSNMLDS